MYASRPTSFDEPGIVLEGSGSTAPECGRGRAVLLQLAPEGFVPADVIDKAFFERALGFIADQPAGLLDAERSAARE